jgi:hypothetical protein
LLLLEEKRESLSAKLKQLKNDYLMIIGSKVQDKSVLKNSLLKQIEVLSELINTVKIKIGLIQQIDNTDTIQQNNLHNNEITNHPSAIINM